MPAGPSARGRALLHRHPAAQRHRLAAYGACAQQHAAGRARAASSACAASDVLWQPGTDHAGIATQMVVERQLMERQEPGRRALGREKFLEQVWAWKAESGGTIINQLKRLGASCDWSRERFTMDEGLSRAVLKVFVELYRDGPDLQGQAAGQLGPEAAHRDLRPRSAAGRGQGHLWHIKYPIEGARATTFITVATTRPETMLGDTAVAVHPDDERYRHLVGKHAILPLVGRRIPIVADEYSDPEKGTGAVKITPAHDFNDFEVGRRHDLPLINVLDRRGQARILQDNEAFLDGLDRCSPELEETLALHGLDRFVARKQIVERMEARGSARQDRAAHPHGAARRPLRRGDRALSSPTSGTSTPRRWRSRRIEAVRDGPHRVRAEATGRRPTSTGWRTSSPGASRASSGGATRFPAWYGWRATATASFVDGRDFVAETRRWRVALRHIYGARPAWSHHATQRRARWRSASGSKRSTSSDLARRGRARHLVLLRAVAVLDARLAATRRRSSRATTRPTCWSPASTSSSSGSRA